MKKSFGVKPWLYPMPTYMIGTYNEDGSVDAMMMAWGGICAEDMVALNLEADHKTVANLLLPWPSPARTRWWNPTTWAPPAAIRSRRNSPAPACTRRRAPMWTPR